MASIIPAILCGGPGTRLWPLSITSRPKQFLPLAGERSLFQDTVLRCRGALFDPRPVIAGTQGHRFLIAEHLQQINVEADILLEPVARNSCAAIALACFQALERDENAIVLALASDHVIESRPLFEASISQAIRLAADGWLVTFGVKPDRPATGYGYIRPGGRAGKGFKVAEFVEKPEPESAARYVEAGYLWNTGNFLFRASTFLAELARLSPSIYKPVCRSYSERCRDQDFIRAGQASFAACPPVSVDYAVMEKTGKAAVVPVDYQWSDMGTWSAVGQANNCDPDGNVLLGDVVSLNSGRNVVHSSGRLTTLIGAENLVVVSTRDTVLVANREQAEQVGEMVCHLRETGRREAGGELLHHRPWGSYEVLDASGCHKVKRITVRPGGELSLQKHRHRAEHWIVINGKATVTLGGRVTAVRTGESVHVPLGAVHRLANHGVEPLILIEVQTGTYLGEDDIIRLEDRYNRCSPPLPGADEAAQDLVPSTPVPWARSS